MLSTALAIIENHTNGGVDGTVRPAKQRAERVDRLARPDLRPVVAVGPLARQRDRQLGALRCGDQRSHKVGLLIDGGRSTASLRFVEQFSVDIPPIGKPASAAPRDGSRSSAAASTANRSTTAALSASRIWSTIPGACRRANPTSASGLVVGISEAGVEAQPGHGPVDPIGDRV